jgi:decaprenylphospho-beta-D-erythro-pentofuranosid-2-ulose 2-reductase
VINALGQPQSVLMLGGTSDIAVALARRWAREAPFRLTLAARPSDRRAAVADELRGLGLEVTEVDFEATDVESHPDVVAQIAAEQDIDVAVVAFGVLTDEERVWQSHGAAMAEVRVNYLGAVSVGVCLAEVMRRQGHGVIVALSSVAGERIRRSNFVYGSAKAGMDGFYLGLGEALRGSGVSVLVVRPGFVRTRMTADRTPAPLAVDAETVAEAIADGVAGRAELIWVPSPMRLVMSGLRHVPRPLFRRLPI